MFTMNVFHLNKRQYLGALLIAHLACLFGTINLVPQGFPDFLTISLLVFAGICVSSVLSASDRLRLAKGVVIMALVLMIVNMWSIINAIDMEVCFPGSGECRRFEENSGRTTLAVRNESTKYDGLTSSEKRRIITRELTDEEKAMQALWSIQKMVFSAKPEEGETPIATEKAKYGYLGLQTVSLAGCGISCYMFL